MWCICLLFCTAHEAEYKIVCITRLSLCLVCDIAVWCVQHNVHSKTVASNNKMQKHTQISTTRYFSYIR